MGRSGKQFFTLLLLVPAVCLAAEPASKSGTKAKAKAKAEAKAQVDIGKIDLGGLGVPSADGIEARKSDTKGVGPKVTSQDVSYTVVEVINATEFVRTATGSKPATAPLQVITLHGRPPVTQKFSTLVRVKATQNVNASIDVVILDPRGDTALSGSGTLSFTGSKNGEVDWVIDWTPTPRPHGGDYKMLVRVAGRSMGTFPMKVVADK